MLILYCTISCKGDLPAGNPVRHYKGELSNDITPDNTQTSVLGSNINTGANEVDPFISPDESSLIFTSGHNGKTGMYISYNEGGYKWSEPQFPGDEISSGESICPSVSTDGRHLFFTSNRRALPGYRDKITYKEKPELLLSSQNGSNDIYRVGAGIIRK